MPKIVKIFWRANLRREILPFLVWFFANRGWTVWTEGIRQVRRTVPFERLDGAGDPVAVVGDSLAMGVGLESAKDSSVAALIGRAFAGSPVLNMSKVGRCIGDVKGCFADTSALTTYRCVIVMAGTMDMVMNTPSHDLERDLRQLCDWLGQVTRHVVLVQAGSMAAGPRFAGYDSLLEVLAERSNRVHEILGRVCAEYPHVHYLGGLFDWSLSTRGEPGWFSPDGFHPSEAWHQKVSREVLAALRSRGAV